jgi:hypothetical protein
MGDRVITPRIRLGKSVSNSVCDSVSGLVGSSVYDSVNSSVRKSVISSVWGPIRNLTIWRIRL